MPRVLIVDDKQHIRLPLAMMLTESGFEVSQSESGEEALLMQRKFNPDVVLLSELLQGVNTSDTLNSLLAQDPRTTCIILTVNNGIPSPSEIKRAGAFDHLVRPFNNVELLATIKRALVMRASTAELEETRRRLEANPQFSEIIGRSPALLAVFSKMLRVAPLNVTLLIQGDSGTGKELVVRAIHNRSLRKAGPFIPINCAAIPTTLFESQFFGYEKGAFTDAKMRHAGNFERANHGTLFLDEVGDLSPESQVKLLRVIEDQEVTRLGGVRPTKLDVRVIAATNVDLEKAVAKGEFRKDLYWRLNVVKLMMPNLRERRGDIPLLINHMLARFNRDLGLGPKTVSAEAREMLEAYDWPGNVRELENALCSAMVIAEDSVVGAHDFSALVRGLEDMMELDCEYLEPAPTSSADGASLSDAVKNAVSDVEKQMIASRLSTLGGNRTATAESLGISRKSLFNKMRFYGLSAA